MFDRCSVQFSRGDGRVRLAALLLAHFRSTPERQRFYFEINAGQSSADDMRVCMCAFVYLIDRKDDAGQQVIDSRIYIVFKIVLMLTIHIYI